MWIRWAAHSNPVRDFGFQNADRGHVTRLTPRNCRRCFLFYGQVQVEDLKVAESPHLLMGRRNRVEVETSVVGGGVRYAVKTSNSLFEEFMRLTGPSC